MTPQRGDKLTVLMYDDIDGVGVSAGVLRVTITNVNKVRDLDGSTYTELVCRGSRNVRAIVRAEHEDVFWARGWLSDAAKALEVRRALAR